MGTLQKLLERFGFVRLRDFGLILTADRRVVSTRSAILDDGGRRIVGWTAGDLAAMELPHWGDPPAAPPPPKLPPAPPPKRIAIPPRAPAPIVAPIAAPPAPAPVAVAPRPEPADEDDWEWQIAAARARAAAEEAEDDESPTEHDCEWEIAMVRARAAHAPTVASPTRLPHAPTVAARRHLPDPHDEPTVVRPMTRMAQLSTRLAEGSSPRTVIPVPAMPVIDPRLVRSYEPPRRFPQATRPPAPRRSRV